MIVVVTLRELVGFILLAIVGVAFLVLWLLDKRRGKNK